ncbi:MAG: beta-ketoacyl-ACP synthase II [Oscillospiraceae bacterium]|nr:beta-ketoacyl-ACP synthase II [Oscillospiraceae bacterium]
MFRVAITGLGAVTPVGNSVPEMWEGIKTGKCGIGNITKFDTSEYKVKLAAEVKDFDPSLTMDKSEIRKSDKFSQFAMAAAVEAMNDSGLVSGENIDADRFGVYFGSGIGGMETFINDVIKCHEGGPRKVSPFMIPAMIINMAAGTIAIRFGCKGPAIPVVTACATSTNAIGEAYRAIKHGYADAVIAGGSEAGILPVSLAGFANMKALTESEDPLRASIPFDKERSGFVMGEGAGVMILEEMEHARNRGAKIYGELCGYGSTCDAHHITAPDPDAEGGAAAIRQAYEESGVKSDNIYINAHGTSTPLNDKSETVAIKKALGEELAYKINVSSTKSMTGHMLGAAGAVEAIISTLALKEGVVPPTIGLREQDPECDLNCTPNAAIEKDLELCLSTSLGFGGHNACVAIKKAD